MEIIGDWKKGNKKNLLIIWKFFLIYNFLLNVLVGRAVEIDVRSKAAKKVASSN